MPRNRNVSFGVNSFPSSTGGSGKQDAADGLYQCQQCGFWLDVAVNQSPGQANEGDGGITIQVSDGVGDPTVSGDYCSFCGSPNNRVGPTQVKED